MRADLLERWPLTNPSLVASVVSPLHSPSRQPVADPPHSLNPDDIVLLCQMDHPSHQARTSKLGGGEHGIRIVECAGRLEEFLLTRENEMPEKPT